MSTWIVRISQKNKIAIQDWEKFVIESNNRRYVTWDKDYRNRIKTGDEIGFIIGEINHELIYFYSITGELSINNRSSHWSNEGYTHSQLVDHDVSKREVIVIDTRSQRIYDYNLYKRTVGYKEKFTPRGTQRARHMYLPPEHPLEVEKDTTIEDDLEGLD